MLSYLLLAALGTQAVPTPTIDGSRLRAGERCYALVRGDQTIGATYQKVSAVDAGGMPAWDIVIHQRVGTMFDMRDHFVVRRSDLRPIAFDSAAMRGGAGHEIALRYTDTRVHGTRTTPEGSAPVDVALDAPVWEGNLWGLTFGAIALAEGQRYRLPIYQYDSGIGEFTLTVTGSETVETPDGPVDAWTVDVGTDPARRTTYLVPKAGGAELGVRGPGFGARLGGDCTGLG